MDIEPIETASETAENGKKSAEKASNDRYVWINGVRCYRKSGKPVGRPKKDGRDWDYKKDAKARGLTALRLMQDIYRDENLSMPERLRAASTALPYETPKLQAVANLNVNAEATSKAEIDQELLEHGIDPELLSGLVNGTLHAKPSPTQEQENAKYSADHPNSNTTPDQNNENETITGKAMLPLPAQPTTPASESSSTVIDPTD